MCAKTNVIAKKLYCYEIAVSYAQYVNTCKYIPLHPRRYMNKIVHFWSYSSLWVKITKLEKKIFYQYSKRTDDNFSSTGRENIIHYLH